MVMSVSKDFASLFQGEDRTAKQKALFRRGLEARASLARQVESLRTTDAEMDRLEGRVHRTTDG